MTRVKKLSLAICALLLAVCLGVGLASCGGKDTEPTYGYGEEGSYYYSASDDTDYILTLRQGTYILTFGTEGYSGTYEYEDGTLTLYEGEEETGYGSLTDSGISLRYSGNTYLFLTYEYYTVTFVDGVTTLTTQSVLNGKAATDPGDATKEGYVFLGWYSDSSYTTRHEFNTGVTGNTTVYARFVRVEGTTEYTITYDFGNGETIESETLNGKIYDLPEAEMSGYTFLGWWVSATNNADELTYKYTDETLYEDTTLYAYFVEGTSYMGASVYGDGITWENYNAAVTEIILRDENGAEIERFNIQSTDGRYSYDFASLPAGKYTLTIQGGGIDETLTYVSHALRRVSGFTVISESILMYSAVPGAEKYYISIECGNPSHDHTMIDNGSSLYYDFSSCDMPAEGITFTVYAYADGRYMSESAEFSYFRGLDKTEVTVEGNEITWETVPYAMQYEVYIDGILVATTSDTSYSLSNYGTGTYEITIRPVTTGYYSELSESVSFTKTTLASPTITNIENYTITWTPVEGATGYIVSINGVETTISSGDITSLILTDENYTEGLDSYEISVKAMAQDSSNDSPYSEAISVTGTSVGSAISYSNGTVTWQYSLSASEYRITVNDGDETVVTGTNSSAVTLTKSGNNEITIYFVNDDGDIYGTAAITVYAYAIVFDARGGLAILNGEEIDAIYVAKGDEVTLPDADRGAITADFLGWYTLPDVTNDPDATAYQGDGYLFEDGTIFTGNSTIVLYAVWLNPRLNVKLDAGTGKVTDENGNLITYVVISLNGRNYTVAVPKIEDKAYVFYGWYSGENGTGIRYTDENGNAYAPFSDETVTTLYAYWIEVLSFSVTTSTYDGSQVLAVSKGPDIGLVSEVTIPDAYLLDSVEYTVAEMTGSAFSSCSNLEIINIPDTMTFLNITNNGYDSGTGVFASTALQSVNVYVTGEPSSTREIIYYSNGGVLFQKTNSGDLELFYYPYGRTDETYEIPETASNENEYEYQGTREVAVVRNVTSLVGSAFRGHTELTSMVIPTFITSTGTYTFYNCTSLKSVKILAEMTKVEEYMFYGCTSLTDVEFSSTITEIGNSAFRNCSSITSVVIPDSVETLGTYAFAGCGSAQSVALSSNIKIIEDYDFQNCTSLKAIEIPYGVTTIDVYAFYGCSAMVTAIIPSSVTSIGNYAFYRCTSLAYLTLSEGVQSIGTYVFYECSALTDVVIPSTVADIGNYAFNRCTGLTEIVISEGVETLGTYTFQNCTALKRVTLPSTMTSVGTYCFDGCSGLESVTICEGLSSMGTYAFRNCTSLKSVNIPSTLSSVPSNAFYGCSVLSSLTIAEGVTTISSNAFYGCYGLTNVTIPSTIKSIGSSAFYNCYKLVEVCNLSSSFTVTAGNSGNGYVGYYALNVYTGTSGESHMVNDDNYLFIYDESDAYYMLVYTGTEKNIILPNSINGNPYAVYKYAFYYDDSITSLVVPGTVTEIGSYAFRNCTSLASVTIAEGVSYIGNCAFYSCTSLTSMIIPSTVIEIDEYAFYGCSSLSSLTISNGVEKIGREAFYQCTSLTSVLIPSSVKTIGSFSFYGCTALTNVTFSEGLETIDTYAFQNCTALLSVTIPSTVTTVGSRSFDGCSAIITVVIEEGVETIGSFAFTNCKNITSLTIGEGVETLDQYAFSGCTSLTSVVVPSTVISMAAYVFADCTSLKSAILCDGIKELGLGTFYRCTELESIVIPSSVESVGNYCFYNCTSLKSAVIEEGVGSIGTYCFQNCSSLTSIVIPSTITSIGNYCFDGCPSLTDVVIPEGVTSIGQYAFRNCMSLTSITIPSTVTSIDNYAFQNCYKLVEVFDMTSSLGITKGSTDNGYVGYYALNVYTLSSGESCLVYLGDFTFIKDGTDYYLIRYTGNGGVITLPDEVGDGFYAIYAYAFYNCASITSAAIPNGVTEIGEYAFYGCSSLVLVTIPSTVAEIGDYAFNGCVSLQSVAIPEGVKTLGEYSFQNCTSLKIVSIPSTVAEVGNYAFDGCSSIEALTISEGVVSIGDYAFRSCSSVEDIDIPSTVRSIGTHAFEGCSSLKEVYIPEGVETLGTYSFQNCTSLTSVYIPSTVTSISNYAFDGCYVLWNLTISEGVETIGTYVFRNCGLMSVTIPSTVTSIGNYAFYYCYKLIEVCNLSDISITLTSKILYYVGNLLHRLTIS